VSCLTRKVCTELGLQREGLRRLRTDNTVLKSAIAVSLDPKIFDSNFVCVQVQR
jgi:hypothetical protein